MNLTADPIPGLIRRVAIPASIGFFFNTMFNVGDTFYAGKLSTDSLTTLSLSFPMYFILLRYRYRDSERSKRVDCALPRTDLY